MPLVLVVVLIPDDVILELDLRHERLQPFFLSADETIITGDLVSALTLEAEVGKDTLDSVVDRVRSAVNLSKLPG